MSGRVAIYKRTVKSAAGKSFDTLVKSSMANFGNVFYADYVKGNDSAAGDDAAAPLKTPAAALTKCVDGNDDVVFLRGNMSDVAFIITKSKVHLYGLQGSFDQSYAARIQSGASAVGPTIHIKANDVEIAFLQVQGNRDIGKNYPAIRMDKDNGGARAYIHDCIIPMLTPSDTQYCNGIELLGDRATVERCLIENSKIGVKVYSGAQTTYRIIVRDCVFRANDVGAEITNLQEATGQHGAFILDNYFDGQGAFAQDRAIKVLSGTPTLARNIFAGYTTALTKGSAKLILNYNETAGGTLET